MGVVTATELINSAAIQLTDTTNVRWTRAELLSWLNSAQRQIVLAQPYANAKTTLLQLITGTRQAIPSDGWMLLDVYRDFANLTTPVRAVREIDRQIIDSQLPAWHAAPQTNPVQNFVYNLTEPLAFFVYPPSDGTHLVEISYSQVPAELSSETVSGSATTIELPDVYATPILDYMCARACMKDAEYAPGVAMAQMYMQQFTAAVGADQASLMADAPTNAIKPKVIGTPGDR
jgi:hypothetical protein